MHTAFIIQWWPYVKYTYRCPGPSNIVALRKPLRRKPWLAGSPGSYASVSTIVPDRRVPSGSLRTSVRPSRSGATSTADRS